MCNFILKNEVYSSGSTEKLGLPTKAILIDNVQLFLNKMLVHHTASVFCDSLRLTWHSDSWPRVMCE